MNKLQMADHYLRVQASRVFNRDFAGPMVAYIEVTKKCNLRCEFCDIWRVKVGPDDEMTTEDLLNLSRDLAALGTKYVALFGGEAMLRRDLFDVIEEMKRLGLYVVLDTNGYFLPQLHKRVLECGVDMLAVSLDSHRPEVHDLVRGLPGGFARAVDGLRSVHASKKLIKLVINSLIVKPNFRELVEIVRMGAEVGVRHFRFLAYNFIAPYNLCGQQSNDLVLSAAEIEELALLLEELIAYCKGNGYTLNSHEFLRGIPTFYRRQNEPMQCVAGYASIHVHADGRLSFCSSLEAGIGNVRQQRLGDIWGAPQFLLRRHEMMSPACDKCWVSCYIEQNHWFRPQFVAAKLVGVRV